LQLRRLSALERQKIIDEYEQVIKLIAELEEILGNERSLRRVIAKELEEVRKDFGDERRTEIVDEGVELSIEDLIADEEVAITVTNSGYIKRTPITTYFTPGSRRQRPLWRGREEWRLRRASLYRFDARVPDDLHGRWHGLQDEGP
jgi:DNA gyrase/topoisomerase IV subunit A